MGDAIKSLKSIRRGLRDLYMTNNKVNQDLAATLKSTAVGQLILFFAGTKDRIDVVIDSILLQVFRLLSETEEEDW